jgi:hypothetical protein
MKPKLLQYDLKESPEDVLRDLEPILKKFGLYLLEDPSTIDTDTIGVILTDNKNLTIKEYMAFQRKEFGKETDDWTKEMLCVYKLKPTDKLQKLIDKM